MLVQNHVKALHHNTSSCCKTVRCAGSPGSGKSNQTDDVDNVVASTTSVNWLCLTVGQCSNSRCIVLVCHKGASTYPIINPTDPCPYSGTCQKTAVLPKLAPSITAPSGLHQVAPTIPMTELHSSSSTVNDNHSTTLSDTPGSAHNPIAENLVAPAPTIEHSTKACNQLMSELLPPTKILSRALTNHSFLH